MKFSSLFIIFAMLLAMANANPYYPQGLKLGFYKEKTQIRYEYVSQFSNFPAGLIRMILFHDCVVRGCDASVLLKPTPYNNETEITAIPNRTLCGLEIIEAAKKALESECTGVVSCADIIALSSREAITAINGPWWEVTTGRRDGKISLALEANALLPSPFAKITSLKENFAALGLNTKDLVVLSGAHIIGIGHCIIILRRLYNFTGNGDTDPSLDPEHAEWLKIKCPPTPNPSNFVFMDTITPTKFDEKYFAMVQQNKGLFESDAALLNDQEASIYIITQVKTMGASFDKDFAKSMIKMLQLGVLTGDQGEITNDCGMISQSIATN